MSPQSNRALPKVTNRPIGHVYRAGCLIAPSPRLTSKKILLAGNSLSIVYARAGPDKLSSTSGQAIT